MSTPRPAPDTTGPTTVNAVQAPLSFFAAMKAVTWSFVGLRSSNGSRIDLNRIKPLHFVLAGFLSLLILITGLLTLVRHVILS